MPSRILVVGGAGYIGSHMVLALAEAGHEVTTYDNLSTGHREAVLAGRFVHGDLCDRGRLARVLREGRFDLVMHFAANAYVRESMLEPRTYYQNNVVGSLGLLDAMLDAGIDKLVFSSTCATYGVAREIPITEAHPQEPVSPYGFSKLVVERALSDYARAYGLSSISLRYFNAAGADRGGRLSERHDPEPHLVPIVLGEAERVLGGGDPASTTLEVFGTDLDTPDGSCVRDYVHVEDLCRAHLLAAERLLSSEVGAEAYNLASERPTSVLELVDSARRVTGADLRFRAGPAKAGDPPILAASAERARQVLGWTPQLTSIDDIVRTAWASRQGSSGPRR